MKGEEMIERHILASIATKTIGYPPAILLHGYTMPYMRQLSMEKNRRKAYNQL